MDLIGVNLSLILTISYPFRYADGDGNNAISSISEKHFGTMTALPFEEEWVKIMTNKVGTVCTINGVDLELTGELNLYSVKIWNNETSLLGGKSVIKFNFNTL